MKSTVEEINSVQRRIKVTVPSGSVNQAFDNAYKSLQKKAKIQGFRPGKAPLYVLKKVYGEQVGYDVSEKLINKNLFNAMDEQGVKPISSPYVEEMSTPKQDTDYEFSAVVDIMPEIKVADEYKNLQVTCRKLIVTDESIDKELKRLAREKAKASPVSDSTVTARAGHLLTVSQKAVDAAGKDLPNYSADHMDIALGLKEVLPEYEEQLLGMSIGETKAFPLQIGGENPENGERDTIQMETTLHNIQDLAIPEINDELAKEVEQESLDKLKEMIRDHMNHSADRINNQHLEESLFSLLDKKLPFEVPPTIVDQVIDNKIKSMDLGSEKQMQDALSNKQLRESLLPECRKKAKNTLLLFEIAKKEEIKVSDDDIKQHIREILAGAPEHQQKEGEIQKIFESSKDVLRDNLTFDKTMKKLLELSQVTYNEMVV